jgi:hypothetical protein
VRAAAKRPGRIAGVLQQGPGGRRYGIELEHEVVVYAFARQDERVRHPLITEEFGLSAGLFGKWLRHKEKHSCMDNQ